MRECVGLKPDWRWVQCFKLGIRAENRPKEDLFPALTVLRQGATGQPGAAGQDQARSREPCPRPSQKPRPGDRPCQVQCLRRASRGVDRGPSGLIAAIRPLLEARTAVEQQVSELDRKVMKLARHDAQVRRFARSRSVGAYVGLTCRRHAFGEVDWSGRISKCGDAMLRSYLFEAAGVLLTRVPKWSAVKAWGVKLVKRNGLRRPRSRSRASCSHSASHVDGRDRVQLVEEGDCCLASGIPRSC